MIWLDGAPASALPLPDRGLDFGDGLFETLLLRDGKPLYSELHLARLQRGCTALSFPDCCATILAHMRPVLAEVAARGWHWTALRVTVTRGAGPRGYAPPLDAVPRVVMSATDLGEHQLHPPNPAALTLASVRWPTQPALAGLKHLNRLEQVLAALQCRQAGADEAVMQGQGGQVISVTSGNLFIALDSQILTARLDECGIAGTRRHLVMKRWAPALGLTVQEQTLTMEHLEMADEVFYSNSLVGLRAVACFGERRWHSHKICAALYQQYLGDLA